MNEKKRTILAIDDDITILNTIRTVLEGSYEVSLAKNTVIAQKILSSAKVDMILLDMNMPGASGLDFLESIRTSDSLYHIPVIIVSAQGTADVIMEIQKRGAVDFVVKPISPVILKEKIRSAFKDASVKASRVSIEIKLKKLAEICAAGKIKQAEAIVKELEQVYYKNWVDAKITEICRYARDMDFILVHEKVEELLPLLAPEKKLFTVKHQNAS